MRNSKVFLRIYSIWAGLGYLNIFSSCILFSSTHLRGPGARGPGGRFWPEGQKVDFGSSEELLIGPEKPLRAAEVCDLHPASGLRSVASSSLRSTAAVEINFRSVYVSARSNPALVCFVVLLCTKPHVFRCFFVHGCASYPTISVGSAEVRRRRMH